MEELIRSLEIARSAVTRAQEQRAQDKPRSSPRFFLGWTVANATVLALVGFAWYSGRLNGPTHEAQAQQAAAVQLPLARVELPLARVELPPAEAELPPAEAELPPAPVSQQGTHAKPVARLRKSLAELTPAQVLGAAKDHDSALRGCLQNPKPVNLEIMVGAGHGELTRVEWAPYEPDDNVQSCLFREIAAIKFPLARSAGRFRLKVGGVQKKPPPGKRM